MTPLQKVGGRKFLIALLLVVAATVLRVLELIDQGTWERVVIAVMALYGAANVTQKATAKVAKETKDGAA
jgi:hypothetical protein